MSLPAEDLAQAQQAYRLYGQGQLDSALALLAPLAEGARSHPAILNLAAVCARAAGRHDQAETWLRKALTLDPAHVPARSNLGLLYRDAGRLEAAETEFSAALQLAPDDVETLTNLGNVYRALRRPADAERSYRHALHVSPDSADALYNLGLLLAGEDRLDEAEQVFRRSLAVRPDQAEVHAELGNILMDGLRWAEAEEAYRAAINLNPRYVDAWYNFGMLLLELRRDREAMAALRETLAIQPEHAEVFNLLANRMSQEGRLAEAESLYREALALRPDSANLHNNFGNLLRKSDRYAEAEQAYRKALELEPTFGHALGQALSCARMRYDWSRLEEDVKSLRQALADDVTGIPALALLSLPELGPTELRRASALSVEKALKSYLEQPALVSSARVHEPGERLRIGYLSSEFFEHAVMHLLTGVLEMHDRERFEIHAYSTGPDQRDGYRQRIEAACEHFHNLRDVSNIAAAQRIAADGIDILVDLTGHTGEARPVITVQRPAPIIVSWLGFPGTLGVPRLADYLIGDAVLTPLEHAAHFSETLAWMPHCYQPNDARLRIGPAPARSAVGLPDDGFVFASFNQAYKLTPQVFTLWCTLLDAAPGSVLWLLAPKDPSAVTNLRREAESRGLDPDRLVFARKLPLAEHIARIQCADLALDTFPYGFGATGSTILRAGVPIITRLGETYVSRMAASQLHAVGLQDRKSTRLNSSH